MPDRHQCSPEPSGSLRKRAEAAWQSRLAQLGDRVAGQDLARLLHELEVHQIELELQNEELRLSRDEVEAAHNELLELYDFAPVGYLTLDQNTVIRKANLKAASQLGVERILLTGQNFRRYCVAGGEADSFWLSLKPGGERSCELRLRRRSDGFEFPALVETAGPIDSGAGPIWRCTITDISDRRQAQQALRESEERFRSLVTACSFAVYRMNADWSEIRCSDGSCFTGERRGISDSWLMEYVHPDERQQVKAAIQRAIEARVLFELEYRVRRSEGTVAWTALRAVPLLDAEGQIMEWFASASDITERKRAEEAIRWQAEMMRLSQDAIIVWRFGGTIISWNQGAATLYGYSETEAIGRRIHELLRTVSATPMPEIEEVLGDLGAWQGELRHRTKDGRELFMSARLQVLRGADGGALVLEMNRDVTFQKRAEQEREREARRKDEFLALLGHELRNPLAAIFNAMQILSGEVAAAQRSVLMNVASQQVTLMRRLLDDLLDLGRLAHGHLELIKERIDLAEYLDGVAVAARPAIVERGQSLVLRLPPEPVVFWADRVRLEQIAGNLLSNASKYTQRGGVIEFSGGREASEIVLKIRDNGRGIPAEMLDTIFEPFARGKATADDYGQASLGIGLALVRELTLLHGGTVAATSGGGGTGSEFTVRIPSVEAPEFRPPSAEERPRTYDQLTIVLVEDNPNTNLVMKMALELAGHQVLVFSDGPSALAGIAHSKPDALLLDIGLPGIDGYELLARMRALPHLRDTLFIGISGFKKRSGSSSGPGFDYYLPKPADLNEILALLAKHSHSRGV